MFSSLAKSFTLHFTIAVLLLLSVLAGCQSSSQDENASPTSMAVNQGANPSSRVAGSMIQDYRLPPQSVQDLVNRSHAIVIGTITAISDPVQELPYGKTEEDFPAEVLSYMYLEVAYYDIAIEEVLLDDGNVSAYPRLRLEPNQGYDSSLALPQLGERYLFTMGRNPDSRSYGVAANWMTLKLEDDEIRNIDDTSPGYVGVTGETTLVEAIRAAVPHHDLLPVNQWPSRFETGAGEGSPSEPGGPGDDDTGPTGNTGEGGG